MTDVADEQEPEQHVNRRGFLRTLLGRGAVAAAGAGAASALLAESAGAAEGSTILIGSANDVNNTGGLTTTTLTNSQFKVVNGNNNLSLAATTAASSGTAIEATAPSGAALKATPTSTIPMPPTSGNWTRGSMRVDDPGGGVSDLWYCYGDGAGSASGWYPLSLVPAFIPLPTGPQRIYDSRPGLAPLDVEKGKLGTNQERDIDVTYPTAFPVPITAFAVLMNLAVTQANAAGFFAVFPGGETWPGSSSINFQAVQSISNNVTSGFDLVGNVTVRAGATAHFLIDVVGFYTLTA